jgi:hypothetical protein
MPEDFFREEQLNYSVAYHKRCCSVYDFYSMLSIDNPCFEERRARRDKKDTLEEPSATVKSPRHEHPAAQDNYKRRDPPQRAILARSANPSFNPFVHASIQSTNLSNLDWE